MVGESRINQLVEEGKLVPSRNKQVEVWVNNDEIAFCSKNDLHEFEKIYIMIWQYYKKKPLFIVESEIDNGLAKIRFDEKMLKKLDDCKLNGIRFAYISLKGNDLSCGYIKRVDPDNQGQDEVWQASTDNDKRYVIFWNGAGILGLKKETETFKKVERELSTINVENDVLRRQRDQFLYELTETRKSKTYRLAQKMVSVPRLFLGYKYKNGQLLNQVKTYPYILSVVVAVYNTEYFLKDLLDSIINQKQDVLEKMLKKNQKIVYKDYVFNDIYELILVDDGSTDNSGKICDEYAKKYPWIKVIHKENGGVSIARNTGIEIASGKYITFPDSDDKLDSNVFEKCILFFEEHQDEISYVTYPHTFFDGQTGKHWTAYRFDKGTRVVDLFEEHDQPQYFTNACFFLTDDIKGKVSFDSNLINGEDTVFANDIVFNGKHKIGLVSDCTYWYRRRTIGELSAIQQSKKTEKYYLPYCTDVLGHLMKSAENNYGFIPRYIQYTAMGQIQWRLRSDADGNEARSVVGEEGFQNYKNEILNLIKKIDVDIIAEQKNMYREHKFYAASVRMDGEVERVYSYDKQDVDYYFDGIKCTNAAGCYLEFDFMKIKNGVLHLNGRISNLEDNVETWAIIKSEESESKVLFTINNQEESHCVRILDDIALYVREFELSIPLCNISTNAQISFYSNVGGYTVKRTMIRLGKFMPISKEFNASYYLNEDWCVLKKGNDFIVNNNADNYVDYETEFQKQVLNSSVGKNPDIKYAMEVRKGAINRRNWNLLRGDNRKIWIVSDRYSVADDNGEAFFRYLSNIKNDEIDVYFVIDKDSADFERLKEYGNVIAQDSKEHHVLHMMADCIISSQGDEYIWDPFWRKGKARELFKDFYNDQKFIFLQHGVIKDDLSKWLNRYNKNIEGFVVSANPEAQSILDCNYYYDKKNVWLTGLPRFDRLYHDEKKHILVMPTWRKWLMKDFDAASSDKDAVHVIDDIEETEFFKFYSGLINNKRLLDTCDKYGYKLCFMPHTNFRETVHKFVKDSRVIAYDFDMRYRDAFAQGNLLVSDYSSTPMDFVYLGKPVVYAQFDKDEFFGGSHTYSKGYFDYEKDGFGEVTYDLESLIDVIIEYVKSDCKMKKKYKKRLDGFFGNIDTNNCQRVYERILNLE